MSGGGVVRHNVTISDAINIALPVFAQRYFERSSDVLRRGGGGYGELDASSACIRDELLNAGSQKNMSVRQHAGVMRGLDQIQIEARG